MHFSLPHACTDHPFVGQLIPLGLQTMVALLDTMGACPHVGGHKDCGYFFIDVNRLAKLGFR